MGEHALDPETAVTAPSGIEDIPGMMLVALHPTIIHVANASASNLII